MLAAHTPFTDVKTMSTEDQLSMKNKALVPPAQFLSTAEAARMLGLSTTLIQTLVDQGDLKGWKTRGGHRRIALESIHEYRSVSRHFSGTAAKLENRPTVSIVIESAHLLEELRLACASYNFPINVHFFDSVTEALLDLSNQMPDMFVVEMSMPRAQQEKTFQALEKFNQRGNSTLSVVLITSEKDLSAHLSSGASSRIQVVSGPLSAVWLNAYLTGILASSRM
ncbi:helix-turn-helix domain-containing protein [Limnohabitans sp.]|jgi:excisionase family DNA binding protein|uniref:helix-turn-helix domain-containing protein n=1 Tax=Limnohabitans sp. TaxID=1907725 RepID=UPI0037BE7958